MKKIDFADFLKKDPLKDLVDYGFGYQDVHKKDCQTSFHGYFQKGHFF